MAKTWSDDDPEAGSEPAPDPARLDAPAQRYQEIGRLGQGGGGEVLRVFDRHLDRVIALKRQTDPSPEGAQRFEAEAQAHAQLQHPNISPVHELAQDEQGRWFFTLPVVEGRTLDAAIAEVHAASAATGWRSSPDGWSLERLVDALVQVSDAVAAAHAAGVLHRDLKPANIMLGPNGEVLVLDWGLARLTPGGAVQTRARAATLHGSISGTPAFIAPEMARGATDRIGPHTDVYGLGAILYQILSGRPPYAGDDPLMVLLEVMAGPPLPPGYAGGDPELDALLDAPLQPGPPVPTALSELCVLAMSHDASRRPSGATAFGSALRAWLEGVGRRERALAYLEAAAAREAMAARDDDAALRLSMEAASQLMSIEPWAGEGAHAQAWAQEDEARAARARAAAARREAEQLQMEAEQEAPELAEVHAALAESAMAALGRAERAKDMAEATRASLRLDRHLQALGEQSPARARGARVLRGDGLLTLWTDPPGAEVWLETYVMEHRRLVARPTAKLGTTPLNREPIPMGSHVLRLRHPDRQEVRYPVYIERNGVWTGAPPGVDDPFPVQLPPLGELRPDEIYVPAGPFLAGGDPEQDRRPPLWLWCDGFVMQRYAITFGQWTDFLNALIARGDHEICPRFEPRYTTDSTSQGLPVLRRDADGRYLVPVQRPEELRPGESSLSLTMPIVYVDHASAAAYAVWRAQSVGQPWRLPAELEWEKAARGVDGRAYPMGPFLDPSWTCVRASLAASYRLSEVDALPDDLSPYGVMGLAGNVRCWCADPGVTQPPRGVGGRVPTPPEVLPHGPNVSRGGAWASQVRASRCSFRVVEVEGIRHSLTGVRLLRPYGPRAPGAQDA